MILLDQFGHGLLDGFKLLLDLIDADIILLTLVDLLEYFGDLFKQCFIGFDDLTKP